MSISVLTDILFRVGFDFDSWLVKYHVRNQRGHFGSKDAIDFFISWHNLKHQALNIGRKAQFYTICCQDETQKYAVERLNTMTPKPVFLIGFSSVFRPLLFPDQRRKRHNFSRLFLNRLFSIVNYCSHCGIPWWFVPLCMATVLRNIYHLLRVTYFLRHTG